MSYLLDTNLVIAFLKNEQSVYQRLKELVYLNISVITVGELFYGALNSQRTTQNLDLYQTFFRSTNIINIDPQIASEYSRIRYQLKQTGSPIPENDIWIAATARANKLTLFTRDKHLLKLTDFIQVESI